MSIKYTDEELKKSGIYRIINLSNEKVYVGSTHCFKKRFYSHQLGLNNDNHYNSYLQNAWNKYGKSNFRFEIIEIVNNLDLLQEREQFWLDKTESYKRSNGYNILEMAYSKQGYKHSEESKRKMSKSKKGNPNNINYTEEIRNKLRLSRLGIKFTDEHKLNISKAAIGIRKTSKLTKEDVLTIRLILRDTDLTNTEIANMFSVSSANINNISKNKSWEDIVIKSNELLCDEYLHKVIEIKNNRKLKRNNTKLNEEQVKTIKLLLRDTELYHFEIGELFGVGKRAIWNINANKRWSDVTIDLNDKLEMYYINTAKCIIEGR